MLLAARFALGPVLLRQAGIVRRSALRLPEAYGPRDAVADEGEPVLRLLVVGDSSAAGVGVPSQDEALAWPLARLLAERLQGAVSWQLVAETGATTLEARAMLARSRLAPADVVITALGVNDVTAQLSAGAFITHTAQLWSDLKDLTGARWGVACGLPPMGRLTAVPQPLRWYLGRYSLGFDAALAEWARRRALGYCGLAWSADPAFLASDGFHPGPALYPVWAERLADIIIDGRQRWAPTVRPELVEGARRELVERPEPLPVRPEPVEGPDRRELVERPELVEGPTARPPRQPEGRT